MTVHYPPFFFEEAKNLLFRSLKAPATLRSQLVQSFSALVLGPIFLLAILLGVLLHFGIWFWGDEKVQRALRESEDVAHVYLEDHRKITLEGVNMMASYIEENLPKFNEASGFRSPSMSLEDFLTVQSRLFFLTEAVIISENLRVLGRSHFSFPIEFSISPALLKKAKKGVVIESHLQNERVIALKEIPQNPGIYLVVSRKISQKVIESIEANREAWAAYRDLLSQRLHVLRYCLICFGLLAVGVLCVAVWRGLYFSRQLLRPIYRLIDAANCIQQGDLHARVTVDMCDNVKELRTLQNAFNQMVDEISTQQRELYQTHSELERRHRFTKNVLEGVSSGVLGLDGDGRVCVANDRAYDLLKISSHTLVGRNLTELLPEWGGLLCNPDPQEGQIFTTSLNLCRTFRVHSTGKESGGERDDSEFVITFEDLTEFLAIQRQAAWSDVARRVAHEIKNPLTPIQLSAERLKRRYLPQITSDPERFQTCVDTIVRQVETIRRIIMEFSSFSRLPKASFDEENLVPVVETILGLYQEAYPHVQWELQAPFTLVCWCDRQQIEQVVTNLLKNGVESLYEKGLQDPDHKGCIRVLLSEDDTFVTLVFEDNGCGLPSELTNRFAEPYWTTKATGTGLGLAIVKKIAEDHGGEVVLSPAAQGGAIARVNLRRTPLKKQTQDM